MNLGVIIVVIMVGLGYLVTGVPTPDEMLADFSAGGKFYTSGAYDQALEEYNKIIKVESRFLNENNILVEFEEYKMHLPVKDAALYKSGYTYLKMVQDEMKKVREAEEDGDTENAEKAKKLAIEYANKGTEFFELTQRTTKDVSLKGMAQNEIISIWYEIYDYDRVIQEGNKLIERYPESSKVLDAMYNIGWAYFDKKQFNDSIEAFKLLVTRFPTAGFMSDRALFQIGEGYYELKQYTEAVPYYQTLVDKMHINELSDLEIQKIQREKLAGLSDETALDLAAKAQLKVGSCYAFSGDYKGAESAYKRVAQLFTYDKNLISEAYQHLADMYMDRGMLEESIRSYRDAIDEVSDKIFQAKMQVFICKRYFDNGRYQDAVREYNHYITVYSDVALRAGFNLDVAFFWLGRAYYELGNEMVKKGEKESGIENLSYAINAYGRIIKDFPDSELMSRVYFYQGMAYQLNGSPEYIEKAVVAYKTLLELYPNSPYEEPCYFFIARAYNSLKNIDEATAFYKKVIEKFPDSNFVDSAWMEMALAYRSVDRPNDALPCYLKVSKKEKELYTTARLLAADYLRNERRYQDVIDVVTPAVEDTSAIQDTYRLAQLYIIRGNAYSGIEKYQQAANDFTRAYDLNDPQTKERASIYRASALINMNELAQAEHDLKELMNSQDEGVRKDARLRLAVISVKQQKSEQALQTYLDLYNTTTDPNEKLNYLRNLIQLSNINKDWDRLYKYATIMIESKDAEGKKVEDQEFYYQEEAYFTLAYAYETQGNYVKARDYLEAGFEKFPHSYFSGDMIIKIGVYYLQNVFNEAGAMDKAGEYFEKYIKLFPTGPYVEMSQYYLGLCYYNGRRFDEALKTFQAFYREYPNSEFTPETLYYYADCLYNLGNMDESIKYMNMVIEKYPKNEKAEEALYTKAWALMDLGRTADGISSLQTLVDRYPSSQFAPHSLYSIADYYYNQQRYQEALTEYQKVLDNYPKSEVAPKVPDTLKDLKETIAYIDYDKAFAVFEEAQKAQKDMSLYRKAAEMFEEIAKKYPGTESEIGSYANIGICYEELGEWKRAVVAYDAVIKRYEEGADVTPEAFNHARTHKQYIEANKL